MKHRIEEELPKPVNQVAMIEAEQARAREEWAGKTPEEKERSSRALLEEHLREMGMTPVEIANSSDKAFQGSRAEWEKEWQERKVREAGE